MKLILLTIAMFSAFQAQAVASSDNELGIPEPYARSAPNLNGLLIAQRRSCKAVRTCREAVQCGAMGTQVRIEITMASRAKTSVARNSRWTRFVKRSAAEGSPSFTVSAYQF